MFSFSSFCTSTTTVGTYRFPGTCVLVDESIPRPDTQTRFLVWVCSLGIVILADMPLATPRGLPRATSTSSTASTTSATSTTNTTSTTGTTSTSNSGGHLGLHPHRVSLVEIALLENMRSIVFSCTHVFFFELLYYYWPLKSIENLPELWSGDRGAR